MGRLIDGAWTDQWYDTLKSGGRFLREDSQLRNWITPDGEPGPSGDGGFRAEADREDQRLDAAPATDEEMPQLVEEDDDRQDEQERHDVDQAVAPKAGGDRSDVHRSSLLRGGRAACRIL